MLRVAMLSQRIQNGAAILDKRLERTDVPVCVECLVKPVLLAEPSVSMVVQPSETYVGPAFTVPCGWNVDMKLKAVTAAETIDARLVWLDTKNEVVTSVSRTGAVPAAPGANTVCRRYPHAFRLAGATRARIEIRARRIRRFESRTSGWSRTHTSLTPEPMCFDAGMTAPCLCRTRWCRDRQCIVLSPLVTCGLAERCRSAE